MEMVIEAGLRARDIVVHNRPHPPDSIPVHQRILAALENGDSAAAETAMLTLLGQASMDIRQADAGKRRSAKARQPTGRGARATGRR